MNFSEEKNKDFPKKVQTSLFEADESPNDFYQNH